MNSHPVYNFNSYLATYQLWNFVVIEAFSEMAVIAAKWGWTNSPMWACLYLCYTLHIALQLEVSFKIIISQFVHKNSVDSKVQFNFKSICALSNFVLIQISKDIINVQVWNCSIDCLEMIVFLLAYALWSQMFVVT